jgi:2-haloacid dehalogenase
MATLQPPPRVLVLDVNETLSDLSHLRKGVESAGIHWTVVDLWFARVLRDGFALAALGESAGFADIARHTLRTLAPDLDDEVLNGFVSAFGKLPLHPDVAPGLRSLATYGVPVVTLSNGSSTVTESLLERAGIRDLVGQVLSVDAAGVWKPARAAYTVALDATGVPAREAAMVAVHPWDLHGAAAAGLRTIWVNRHGQTYPEFFTAPDLTVTSFEQLAARLAP